LRGDRALLSLFALHGTVCCAEINLEARHNSTNGRDMARKIDIRPHILSSSQLAERLKISKKTLGRMIKDGRIPDPNRSPGNQWRFWTIQEALEIEELLKGGNVD
jgi:excisionase family DNA binding protein